MPNARSLISAQNRMTFSPLRRWFSRSQAPIRSLTRARGSKSKLWRAIQRIPASLDALVFLAQEEAAAANTAIGGNASLSFESPPAHLQHLPLKDRQSPWRCRRRRRSGSPPPESGATPQPTLQRNPSDTLSLDSGRHSAASSRRSDDEPEGSGGRS